MNAKQNDAALRFREDNLVSDVNYTVAGHNICCNYLWIWFIVPLSHLVPAPCIAFCGGEIIAGVATQCVDFPVAIQILFEVYTVRNVVLEDISQLPGRIFPEIVKFPITEFSECIVAWCKNSVGAFFIKQSVKISIPQKFTQNIEVVLRTRKMICFIR